jgi:hypothetical protein
VTLHQQGDDEGARASLVTARGLATDDDMRRKLDDMIAQVGGSPPPPAAATTGSTSPPSPFQSDVEQAFRAHPIMGPRIVGFEWTGPAAGRVLVQNFPMEGMPPAVRDKFASHLGEQLRAAQSKNGVDGPVRMEIADASSGRVMATVTP